jgi:hypothetical protein
MNQSEFLQDITRELSRLLRALESQRRTVLPSQEIIHLDVERPRSLQVRPPPPPVRLPIRPSPLPLTTTRPRKIQIKTRALAKADINVRMDTCAICLEQHTKINSVITSCCNHSFGNECLKGWQQINPKCPCPACRNPTFSLTAFRPRKTRVIVL